MNEPSRPRRHALRAVGASVVGSRLLSPLRMAGSMAALAVAPAFVRHAQAADVERFGLGVASGQPRADRVVLWTRLTGAALPPRVAVQWELAEDEGFARIAAKGEFDADALWAHSVHAEPMGLKPSRWYWYRFTALGQRSMVGRTRTAPAADEDAASLSFAIASCQRFDVAPFAAWRHLSREPLDAVMFLGDYIYESGSPANAFRPHEGGVARTLDAYRARYAQYKGDLDLQAAHAACPWLIVWDDHEVDNDYAGDQSQSLEAQFALRRAAAYQAYWEHMPFTMAQRPRGAAMRIFDRFTWGRLASLHLLDDRQHRDAQACSKPGRGGSNVVRLAECPELLNPKRTLLGAAQERWLTDGLDIVRPWNLIAQQTLMARFSWSDTAQGASYWTDGWDGYPAARKRLLGAVAERKLAGAVVLGGDVHTHYVASLRADFDDAKSPVVASEFCGTSITSRSLSQSRIDAGLALNPHVHFGRGDKRGAITFKLDTKRLEASLLGVEDPSRADSASSVMARFVVEHGEPGPKRA